MSGLAKGCTVVIRVSEPGAASSTTRPTGRPAGKLTDPDDVITRSSIRTGSRAPNISRRITSELTCGINTPVCSPTITLTPLGPTMTGTTVALPLATL